MSNAYSFLDFAFSKEIVQDMPQILRLMDKFIESLKPHVKYKYVWTTYRTLEDHRMMLQLQYDYYRQIYEKRGLIDE